MSTCSTNQAETCFAGQSMCRSCNDVHHLPAEFVVLPERLHWTWRVCELQAPAAVPWDVVVNVSSQPVDRCCKHPKITMNESNHTLHSVDLILVLKDKAVADLGVDLGKYTQVDLNLSSRIKLVSVGATARFSRHNCNWFYAKSNWKYKKCLWTICIFLRTHNTWKCIIYKIHLIIDTS